MVTDVIVGLFVLVILGVVITFFFISNAGEGEETTEGFIETTSPKENRKRIRGRSSRGVGNEDKGEKKE